MQQLAFRLLLPNGQPAPDLLNTPLRNFHFHLSTNPSIHHSKMNHRGNRQDCISRLYLNDGYDDQTAQSTQRQQSRKQHRGYY